MSKSVQTIVHGDCLDVFKSILDLQAIVSDPPAGINFMGRSWDALPMADRKKALAREDAFSDYWAERFDVARMACVDDAVALIWALPRTQDLTMRALRLAGWHIRDVITHHFGQGWPKDKNALKPASEAWILAVKGKPALGIDACRVERGGDLQPVPSGGRMGYGGGSDGYDFKPNAGGSWPTNLVLSHFASDDGSFTCRPCGTRKVRGSAPASGPTLTGASTSSARGRFNGTAATPSYGGDDQTETVPAYLCAVGCDCGRSWLAESGGEAPRCECGLSGWWCCPVAEMDRQGAERGVHSAGSRAERGSMNNTRPIGYGGNMIAGSFRIGDVEQGSSASRFFPRFGYHAKAPSGERHAGCEDLFWRVDKKDPFGFVRVTREEWEKIPAFESQDARGRDVSVTVRPNGRAQGNVHPTVKRLSLMRWLHALTGAQRIGDLCGGSGSGMVAAYLDGIDWIGAEVCPQAIEIANARLAWWKSLSPKAREAFELDKGMTRVNSIRAKEAQST